MARSVYVRKVVTRKGKKAAAYPVKRNIRLHLRQKPKPSVELLTREVKGFPKTAMPSSVSPMLATPIKQPFNSVDWIFELKWDGYRSIAFINNGNVQLRSRRDQNFNHYQPVVEALQQIKMDAVIDGEVVVLNEEGKADFSALEKWRQKKEAHLVYYVFDLLWLNGIDISKAPLTKRKELLKKILPENDIIKFSDSIDEAGIDFFELVKKNGLEGMVAKRKDSSYQFDKRSADWYKIFTSKKQEFVIGGWTESGNGRLFKSILFGYYNDKGQLIYFGHSGHGVKEKDMGLMLKVFKKFETKKSPFANETDRQHDIVHFMKPELVGVFEYRSVTVGGKIRHPAIFIGFRDDKKPAEVRLETDEVEKEEESRIIQEGEQPAEEKQKVTAEDSNWKELETIEVKSSATKNIGGKKVTIINPGKRLWGTEEKPVTKADLVKYYHSVYKYMAPHLKDRPLSLHVKHIAPNAKGLYIKDMEGRQPDWAEIFTVPRKHKKKGKRDIIDYLVCNNEATLQYIVSLGCIDVNPWTSRTTSPEQPDFIIIDLDPSDNDFKKVIKTALAAKKYFDKKKIIAFPKTSGKTGLHLYVPCSGFTFAEARTIAENICKSVHALLPAITTTTISISARGNKLYIDPNQNDYADTVAAPYSVRPSGKPTVSTPLEWKEINEGLDPGEFTIESILKRLKTKGDLWVDIEDEKYKINNNKKLQGFLL